VGLNFAFACTESMPRASVFRFILLAVHRVCELTNEKCRSLGSTEIAGVAAGPVKSVMRRSYDGAATAVLSIALIMTKDVLAMKYAYFAGQGALS